MLGWFVQWTVWKRRKRAVIGCSRYVCFTVSESELPSNTFDITTTTITTHNNINYYCTILLLHNVNYEKPQSLVCREKTEKNRKQSEPADLRQGHDVRQVAAKYSVWQRFPLCPIESNFNENFKVIQNPGFLPDHPQNWIIGSFCHSRHSQKISERSVHNVLSYLADTQTDR